jgi:hypothetical protein
MAMKTTTSSSKPVEVMIDVDPCYARGCLMTPFGVVGNPPRYKGGEEVVSSVFLVTPDVVAACLGSDGFTYDGFSAWADRCGVLTVVSDEGGRWKYVLYPGSWSDVGFRDSPPIYLAVWPD